MKGELDRKLQELAEKCNIEYYVVREKFEIRQEELEESTPTSISDETLDAHAFSILKNELLNIRSEDRDGELKRNSSEVQEAQPEDPPEVDDTTWQRVRYYEHDEVPLVEAISKQGKRYPAIVPASLCPLPEEWSWIELTFETDNKYAVIVDGSPTPPWEEGQ